MAINAELPISKVTFDDKEISLASSGGGGEEVIQETYAGTDISNCYTKIRELTISGRLVHIKLTTTATISLSNGTRHDITGGKVTQNSYSDSISPDSYLILKPSYVQSINVIFTTSYSTKNATVAIDNTKLLINFHNTYSDSTTVRIYSMSQEFPLTSFNLEISYFA